MPPWSRMPTTNSNRARCSPMCAGAVRAYPIALHSPRRCSHLLPIPRMHPIPPVADELPADRTPPASWRETDDHVRALATSARAWPSSFHPCCWRVPSSWPDERQWLTDPTGTPLCPSEGRQRQRTRTSRSSARPAQHLVSAGCRAVPSPAISCRTVCRRPLPAWAPCVVGG
jgi:hypothetical protein